MAVHFGTWTGDSSTTTSIGAAFQLRHVTVKVSSAITNSIIISLDSGAGVNYDTELLEIEARAGITNVFATFDDDAQFEAGDEIKVESNVGASNAYCRIAYTLL